MLTKRLNWAVVVSQREDTMWKGKGSIYSLLGVLLSCIHRAFAHLEAKLGGGIVHEAGKCGLHVIVTTTRLSASLGGRRAITVAIGGCRRWWGGTELGDGGDVLRDGMVQRRRVGGGDGVGRPLHGDDYDFGRCCQWKTRQCIKKVEVVVK